MAKFDVDVIIKKRDKEIAKTVKKADKEYSKKDLVYNDLIFEILQGLPSGVYSIEWDIKAKP